MLPDRIVHHVAGDVVHPSAEAAFACERMAVLKHPVKHRLNHVFTGVGVTAHVVEKTEQFAMVALKEQAHLVQVTRPDVEHDGIVHQ